MTAVTVTHSERSHRILGGSNADRWMNCPGSIFLSKGLPPQIAGARAERGTHAHELAEKAVESMLVYKLTGEPVPGVKEMLDAEPDSELIEWVARYCELIWEKVLKGFVTKKAWGVEDTFTFHDGYDQGGTIDFWSIERDDRAKRALTVVDFKTGYHEVDIKGAQMPFYVCALREELLAAGKDIDYCRCVVIQPPLGIGEDYKEVTYNVKQLDAWRRKFLKAGEQIFVKQKPKYKTGFWCKWCPAQAKCSKYQEELSAGSGLGLTSGKDIILPDVAQISDENIVRLILIRKKLELLLKNLAVYVISRARSGTPLAGLKVVEGVKKREWIPADETIAEGLAEQFGITKDDLYSCKIKGLGKVEALLKETGMTAKEAKAAIEPFVQIRPAAISVVGVDDPRPAIESVGDLLGDIEIEPEE